MQEPGGGLVGEASDEKRARVHKKGRNEVQGESGIKECGGKSYTGASDRREQSTKKDNLVRGEQLKVSEVKEE